MVRGAGSSYEAGLFLQPAEVLRLPVRWRAPEFWTVDIQILKAA